MIEVELKVGSDVKAGTALQLEPAVANGNEGVGALSDRSRPGRQTTAPGGHQGQGQGGGFEKFPPGGALLAHNLQACVSDKKVDAERQRKKFFWCRTFRRHLWFGVRVYPVHGNREWKKQTTCQSQSVIE